ncbi:hypothetical protein BGZ93_001272 [Podila epicladia]|nr:hypothetical protein BGZ93_001272 [Podila epicladia]
MESGGVAEEEDDTHPDMHNFILLLSALCLVQFALASVFYNVHVENNDGSKYYGFYTEIYERTCFCISQTQTYLIDGDRGGDVKLFASSDCTGNYASGTKETRNAQWVNSISMGKSGIPSDWSAGRSCKWY